MDGTDQAIVTAKYTSSNHYFTKKIKKTIFKLSWTWKSYNRYGFEIGLWPLPKRTCFMMAPCLARKIHMNIPEASINRALKHVFVSVSSFDKKKFGMLFDQGQMWSGKKCDIGGGVTRCSSKSPLEVFLHQIKYTCSVSVQGGPGAQILSRVDLWRVGW